jgi:hypothetical protein
MTATTTAALFYRGQQREETVATKHDDTQFVTSPDGKVTIRFEEITPEIATKYLAMNTNNRSLSNHLADVYGIDMKKGRWRVNTAGIGFDVNGVLVDGQHRLEGIIRSDTTQVMMVIRGLDPEARATIDIGRKRTVGDELRMKGHHHNNTLAAAVRMRMLYEDQQIGLTQTVEFTNQDIIEYAEEWADSFSTAISKARSASKNLHVAPMALATAWSIFYEIDPDLCEHYFEKLTSGENVSGTILTVIRRFQLQAAQQAKLPAAFNLWILIRGWNALRKGEELKRIILPDSATGKNMLKAF